MRIIYIFFLAILFYYIILDFFTICLYVIITQFYFLLKWYYYCYIENELRFMFFVFEENFIENFITCYLRGLHVRSIRTVVLSITVVRSLGDDWNWENLFHRVSPRFLLSFFTSPSRLVGFAREQRGVCRLLFLVTSPLSRSNAAQAGSIPL